MADILFLASSNEGKLNEFRVLASAFEPPIELGLLPGYSNLPEYEEDAPTFAENALGKALYYSRCSDAPVIADDSGLVVPALDGAPGVHSARYAGTGATTQQKIDKLLAAMRGTPADNRNAHFVCAIALARRGHALAIVTDRVEGTILEMNRGTGGFGYDPVFYLPDLEKSFAELSAEQKNMYSHRGKAFRRLLAALGGVL